MNLAAGMSGLKAAADMTRALRDGLKAGTIKPDEIAGRIGEIYDYIIDSKDALVDAKDEIETLKVRLKTITETQKLREELQHDGKVYWLARGDRWDGPFCSKCWDQNEKLVRLEHQRPSHDDDPGLASFWCPVDHNNISTLKRPMIVPEQPRSRY